jgi:polyhydroxyalkanoate synthesis regulator phasin
MARRPKRKFEIFTMAFLDVMSCGFGSIVLLYMLVNHQFQQNFQTVNKDALSEIRKLDFEVKTGQMNLAQLRQSVVDVQRRIDDAKLQRTSLTASTRSQRDALAMLNEESLATREHLNALKSDVESREEEVKRLQAEATKNDGTKARSFQGEGDRQYLTGLKVGGARVLIALDTSSSMLDETIVNVLRRRNMDDDHKRNAPKWKRAVATTQWLIAQLPLESQFQIVVFNVEAKSLLGDSNWHDVSSKDDIEKAAKAVIAVVPNGGTNFYNLIATMNSLSPAPDNVYLVTDGLPTQGQKETRGTTINGRQRLELFDEALKHVPGDIPMNVILLPMEGDPYAAAAFWGLARSTHGGFLTPSKDWP